MPRVGTIRGAPTRSATDTRLQSKAVGMPARSNSFASVAPQRVPVPQVAVRIAAWIPARRSSAAHSTPKRRAFGTVVPLPVVAKYSP
jgi:hypothetical protein